VLLLSLILDQGLVERGHTKIIEKTND